MASILDRFNDIIKANVNALVDKMEDPSKMIDQYLREMMDQLAEVKRSTAGVMAQETSTKRLVDDNQAEVAKYADFAKRALVAGNEDDARTFIAKKQELENAGAGLVTAYAAAHENAVRMRQMHDKLASDIEALESRREMINAKVSVARTQETLNEATAAVGSSEGAMNAFSRMEDKANKMLDTANAMAELDTKPVDTAEALETKYAAKGTASVDEELNKMRVELGL
ncbi:MAG: PspA/IM30 family protein [Caldiserica bacterium]|nr:PspA/IM30 family protein [Caldisericota bacterium]